MAHRRHAAVVCLAALLAAWAVGCEQDRYMRSPDREPEYKDLTFDQGVQKFSKDTGKVVDDTFKFTTDVAKFVWPFKPPKPIQATRVDVIRQSEPFGKKGPADDAQRLSLNLLTGHVVLVDADGRKYPNQLDSQPPAHLKSLLDNRQWEDDQKIKPKKSDTSPEMQYYELHVYVGDTEHKEKANWIWPTAQDVPEAQQLATQLFIAQYRRAHPLSEHINLLRADKD